MGGESQREYPMISACGLNCGLCPRFYTKGASKCPGCGGEGFSSKHPACGVLSCSQRHGVEVCSLCGDFPCKRYDGASLADSFISHRNQMVDLQRIKDVGMDAYLGELNKKIAILHGLLEGYDDGRRKSFYCVAVNLLEITDLEQAMIQIEESVSMDAPVKERAAAAVRLLETLADDRGISLKLRKRCEGLRRPTS